MKRLFNFIKKTNEQRAIKHALKLRSLLFKLGYETPIHGTVRCINIWEFDTGQIHIEECRSNIKLVCRTWEDQKHNMLPPQK